MPRKRFLSIRKIAQRWEVAPATAEKSLQPLLEFKLLRKRERSGFFITCNARENALLKIKPSIHPLPPPATWENQRFFLNHGRYPAHQSNSAYFTALFENSRSTSPSHLSIIEGLRQGCKEIGMELQLTAYGPTPTSQKSLAESLRNENCKGIALFRRKGVNEIRPLIRSLLGMNKPVLLAFDHCENLDVFSVNINNITLGFNAIQNLVKQGHRRILLLSPKLRNSDYLEDRLTGARLAAEKFCTDHPIDLQTLKVNPDRLAASRLKSVLSTFPPPTAIFSTSSIIVRKLRHILSELNMEVPKDISIIVCSSQETQQGYPFRLDTMKINFFEIGRQTVLKLHTITQGKPVEKATILTVPYTRGESVRNLISAHSNES